VQVIEDGRSVAGLGPESFEIYDGGKRRPGCQAMCAGKSITSKERISRTLPPSRRKPPQASARNGAAVIR